MTERRLEIMLRQLRDAAVTATTYVEGLAAAAFLADRRTQQAVAMNLIIMGEQSNRILKQYADFAASHPGIRWQSMSGMRNFIAHGYNDLDFDIVWQVVSEHLPPLIDSLTAILDEDCAP